MPMFGFGYGNFSFTDVNYIYFDTAVHIHSGHLNVSLFLFLSHPPHVWYTYLVVFFFLCGKSVCVWTEFEHEHVFNQKTTFRKTKYTNWFNYSNECSVHSSFALVHCIFDALPLQRNARRKIPSLKLHNLCSFDFAWLPTLINMGIYHVHRVSGGKMFIAFGAHHILDR